MIYSKHYISYENSMDIEIEQHNDEGYKTLIKYESWRVAIANYSKDFEKEEPPRMERHLETDEAFVLLEGEATLMIGEEKKEYKLEKNKIYNIKKGVWHSVFMLPGGKVLIIENSDTGGKNTERKRF